MDFKMLLEKCQIWNEDGNYAKIIEELEMIPYENRTPETDSELARAYANIAEPSDRELFKKAIDLLVPHEEYFEGDHCWNFRMAYAYYYLEQEGLALRYFEKALEARPGDEDTKLFINDCKKCIAFPRFTMSFRERTQAAWNRFVEEEEEIRHIMDEDKNHERGEEIIDKCEDILNIAFDNIAFEMGYNGEKYEIILTPEGDKVKLFELVYFANHVPECILANWNILVGRQANENIGLRIDDLDISGEDVEVWIEEADKEMFNLSVYCEKLLPIIDEDENKVWWILTTLTDQILGEISHMRYIYSFDVLKAKRDDESIKLSKLPEKLEEMGSELSNDAENYLELYTGYEMNPNDDPDADWRFDIIAGSSCCLALINGYFNDDDFYMDELHADGIVAGFICYPLDTLREEDGSEKIFAFRDKLEESLKEECGDDAFKFIGGATGVNCGYIDFIAWDLKTVLYIAKDIFDESDISWATFHTFRRTAGTISLKNEENDDKIDDLEYSDMDLEGEEKGHFLGFVLMSEGIWDKQQFICDLKEKWDIVAEEDGDKRDDSLVFEIDNMIAAVSLFQYPIPEGEAEINAENNYMWPEAVEVAKEHKAHIMIAILGNEENTIEKGELFTKLVATCCNQEYATGVYTSGVVFEPAFYENVAYVMKEGELPIYNWIWFGMYKNENGLNAYTYGMYLFGKDEMEVLNVEADPEELRDFLVGITYYVIEGDVELQDGETIGCSEEDIHKIERSEGVSIPGMTLKISYEAEEY